MNEKLMVLANQAGFFGENMYPVFGTCQETALKNFAELIIAECANVANRAENNYSEVRRMDEVITSHFGVNQ